MRKSSLKRVQCFSPLGRNRTLNSGQNIKLNPLLPNFQSLGENGVGKNIKWEIRRSGLPTIPYLLPPPDPSLPYSKLREARLSELSPGFSVGWLLVGFALWEALSRHKNKAREKLGNFSLLLSLHLYHSFGPSCVPALLRVRQHLPQVLTL